jgi:hypothetical protein
LKIAEEEEEGPIQVKKPASKRSPFWHKQVMYLKNDQDVSIKASFTLSSNAGDFYYAGLITLQGPGWSFRGGVRFIANENLPCPSCQTCRP